MKFHLKRGKPVRERVRKLFAFHLKRCGKLLAAMEAAPGRIHEARKSIKRLRALLSLVGNGQGEDHDWLDEHLRDVNRAMSPIRDAESLREAFDRLTTLGEAPPDEFAAVRAALLSWSDHHATLTAEVIQRVTVQIKNIQERWKNTRLAGHGWSLMEDNIRKAYRRCRKALHKLSSEPDAADLHEFRKRVKQTQYHWEFLKPICEERMMPEVESLEALSDSLGRHHDSEMLKQWIVRQARPILSERTRQLVLRRIDQQQRELARDVLTRAPTLFAESPRHVCGRLHDYWKKWRSDSQPTPPPPAQRHNREAVAISH